jgi:hypothetical protein
MKKKRDRSTSDPIHKQATGMPQIRGRVEEGIQCQQEKQRTLFSADRTRMPSSGEEEHKTVAAVRRRRRRRVGMARVWRDGGIASGCPSARPYPSPATV